jgi:hypothetical protein
MEPFLLLLLNLHHHQQVELVHALNIPMKFIMNIAIPNQVNGPF